MTLRTSSNVVSCPPRQSSIFQHPKNRKMWHSDVLGAGGIGESLRDLERVADFTWTLPHKLALYVCVYVCMCLCLSRCVYLCVCVCGASQRLTQAAPHKLAILLPVDCPQQLNHPDCLRFCGKGDVDQASSKIDL